MLNFVAHVEGGAYAQGVRENRVPRRIFRPKTDEVTREWRRLHNVEL